MPQKICPLVFLLWVFMRGLTISYLLFYGLTVWIQYKQRFRKDIDFTGDLFTLLICHKDKNGNRYLVTYFKELKLLFLKRLNNNRKND